MWQCCCGKSRYHTLRFSFLPSVFLIVLQSYCWTWWLALFYYRHCIWSLCTWRQGQRFTVVHARCWAWIWNRPI
jgi:hypothetical protein